MNIPKIPKDILAIFTGILLIALVFVFTLSGAKKESQAPIDPSSETSKMENFFQTVQYIQAEELQKEMSEKTIVIFDLRSRENFEISHIPNSIPITPDKIVPAFNEKKPTPDKVILIDESGQSENLRKSIENLRAKNIQNISILSGGYGSWNTLSYQSVSWGDPQSALDHSKIRAISIENAKKLLSDEEVIFLDVRTTDQYNKEHLERSMNVPLQSIESSGEVIPKAKMIIVYGADPLESFQGGVRLFDSGHLLAYTLVGGYVDLKQ